MADKAVTIRTRSLMFFILEGRMSLSLVYVFPTMKFELKEKLAKMYKVKDLNSIFVFKFRTHFGGGKSTGFDLIYDSVENTKKYEPK